MSEDPGLLLIVDGNNALLRAHYAMQAAGLSTKDGRPTGGLYGAIRIFHSYVQKLNPTHVIWFFDHSRSKFRLNLDPTYKADRSDKHRAETGYQFSAFDKYLSVVNARHYRQEGLEADDLIAQMVMENHDKIPIAILSADHDLRQLVRQEPFPVTVIKPREGTSARLAEKMYTYKKVVEDYGFEPNVLPQIWALMGDSSDNIKGVPGMGWKTAAKALKEYGSFDSVIVNHPKLEGYERKVWVNLQMIQLPHEGMHPTGISLEECEFTGEFDKEVVRKFFEEWEFESFLTKLDSSGGLWS